MKSILHKLVTSFGHPTGVPSETGEAAILLVSEILGDSAARLFATSLVENTPGFVSLSEDGDKLWKKMLQASSRSDE